jgi:hypothetical protein
LFDAALSGQDCRMKWTRAVSHLESFAQTCADMATRPATIFPLRVTQLWAFDGILGPVGDIDDVSVVLGVDLPADDVSWLSEPSGSHHWAMATRLTKNPLRPFWRSMHAPVWNHRIVSPVLVWDNTDGVAEETLTAIRGGHIVRATPPTTDELRDRLADEVRISLAALRDRTNKYDDRRWKPGKMEPVADALWQASDGYLDVLDAYRSYGS